MLWEKHVLWWGIVNSKSLDYDVPYLSLASRMLRNTCSCVQVRGDHAIEGPLEFHSWKGARSDLVAPHEGEGGQHN